ncbi:MAG: NFACT RNA binding domain-containing protein [Candidatus Micrarchaeota archaeon]
MRVKIFIEKSIHDNAAYYYEQAKEARKKAAGAEKAIVETKKEMGRLSNKKQEQKKVRVKRKKEWYEAFHWFFTSDGKLAVGGKTAQQNDLVFKKHMDDVDLFFHADIQGGSAMILKDGTTAPEQELKEVAQFAASFSNAWKNANAAVDVYAVKKEQVAKHAQGGYIPTGAFAITGERQWFRSTPLAIKVGLQDGTPRSVPANYGKKLDKEITIVPGKAGYEKGQLAKKLATALGIEFNDLMELLPSGKTKIKR